MSVTVASRSRRVGGEREGKGRWQHSSLFPASQLQGPNGYDGSKQISGGGHHQHLLLPCKFKGANAQDGSQLVKEGRGTVSIFLHPSNSRG